MKHKFKVEYFYFFLWIAIMIFYRGLLFLLQRNQLECREWVTQAHLLLMWGIPLLIIGTLIWRLHQKLPKWQTLVTAGFVVYCILAVLVFLSVAFCSAFLQNTTEFTMDDGNYEISVSGGFLEGISYRYYAEPVTIFARKRFEWDEKRYAQSLSKIYDVDFHYVGNNEHGDPQFSSPSYYDIIVTVYGVESHKIYDDLNTQLTSLRLQEEWNKHFVHGEELVLFHHDFYSDSSSNRTPIFALVVVPDKLEDIAADIVSFIKEECDSATRTDGKKLYKNVNGSICLLFKESETSTEYIRTRNIPYGTSGNYFWLHDASVTAEEIISDLEYEFQCYYDTPYKHSTSYDIFQSRELARKYQSTRQKNN